MSSFRDNRKIKFEFKQNQQRKRPFSSTPKAFENIHDDENDIFEHHFPRHGNKRLRQSFSPKSNNTKRFKENPENSYTPNNNFQALSDEILQLHSQLKQTETTYSRKWKLCEDLFSMFVGIVPNIGVYLVGSSANGFATEDTDADICIVISSFEIDQKREAVKFLEMTRRALRRKVFNGQCDLIRARVPILRFTDFATRLRCDININNATGIRNTDLLRFYSETDDRIAPLVLCLKTWAKFHNINDASQKTLSSYSLTLMCLFYLQAIVKPAVVPVWQKILPDRFDTETPVSELKRNDEPKRIWQSENRQQIGELFIGFLKYFSKDFRFEKFAISIRKGCLIDKHIFVSNDVTNQSDPLIAIEEPFDLTNTARSVYDEHEFERIIRVFRQSHSKIEKTRSFQSIITETFD